MLGVRIGDELLDELHQVAEEMGVTLRSLVMAALRRAIEDWRAGTWRPDIDPGRGKVRPPE